MSGWKVKFLRVISLMIFLCLFSCWGKEAQEPSHKNILVIHSQDQTYSAYLNIIQSFTKQMCSPELDCEYDHFEIKVRTLNDQFAERFEPYRQKIRDRQYDAIVCIGNMAYWHLNTSELFNAIPDDVPILYIVVDYDELTKPHAHYRNTYTFYPFETVKLALSVFPDRRNIAFLADDGWEKSELGKEFTHSIETLPDVKIDFYSPTGVTDIQLLEKLSENKENTFAIVYDWPRRNESLQAYMLGMVNIIRELDQFGIPVFVLRDYLMVDGAIGGMVTYVGDVGKDAANWLMEYFKKGENNDYQPLVYYDKILDWNLLQKYNVRQSRVPVGTIVSEKPYSFWDHNQNRIIMLVGMLFVVLSLLLAVALRRINKNRHHILLKNDMLKVTVKRACQAEAAKGRFLSNMSHEIRTPLSVIISLSDLLQFKNTSEREKEENLTTIHYASESLLKLINNILDFSKLEEGKMKIRLAEVPIREMLNEIDKIFQVKAAEKKLGFHCECRDLPPVIWLDELHIREIIVNLVGNSMKFTEKGKVELDAAFRKVNAETGTLTVKIKDTGIGISPEFLKNLFKPFSQEGRSNEVGTGLGLTISRQLAQAMGGDLTVESELGKGSTFTLEIPGLKYSEVAQTKKPSLDEKLGAGTLTYDCRMLVVDDMQMNLMVISKMMKRFGVVPLMATTVEKSLQMLKENEVDIILTDLRMPGMNGDQLAREIRKLPNGQKAKIYVLTADAYAKEEIDMTGVDDVLVKPLSLDKIKDLLKNFSKKAD